MPLPFNTPETEVNILHSWLTLRFWVRNTCPEINVDNGVLIIQQLKKALIEKSEEVQMEGINESEENCQHLANEFHQVVLRHPEFIAYWKFQRKKFIGELSRFEAE